MSIQSKSDRDRVRQKSAQRRKHEKVIAQTALRLIKEHDQGRSASACMADLKQAAQ